MVEFKYQKPVAENIRGFNELSEREKKIVRLSLDNAYGNLQDPTTELRPIRVMFPNGDVNFDKVNMVLRRRAVRSNVPEPIDNSKHIIFQPVFDLKVFYSDPDEKDMTTVLLRGAAALHNS